MKSMIEGAVHSLYDGPWDDENELDIERSFDVDIDEEIVYKVLDNIYMYSKILKKVADEINLNLNNKL